MDPISASLPTKITIPAPPQPEQTEASWRDAPLARRHQASNYRGQEIAGTDAEKQYFGEDGLQVSDILDVLNPLQHIPFVSSLYRELTGDTMSTAAKFAGGALLGGPVGLIASVIDTVFEGETGGGVAESAIAALTGKSPGPTQLAHAPAKGISEAQVVAELYPSQQQADPNAPIPVQNIQQKIAAERYASMAFEQTSKHIEIIPPTVTSGSTTVPNSSGNMSAAVQSQAMIDLYGATPAPAHKAYRDANMLGYLSAASSNAGVNAVM